VITCNCTQNNLLGIGLLKVCTATYLTNMKPVDAFTGCEGIPSSGTIHQSNKQFRRHYEKVNLAKPKCCVRHPAQKSEVDHSTPTSPLRPHRGL